MLPSDQSEFFKEWAREKSTSVLSSTVLEPGDEDEEPVYFNKTITGEIDAGAMETKREFLTKFLGRKLIELSEILASRGPGILERGKEPAAASMSSSLTRPPNCRV